MAYDVFVSYSHAADDLLAERVQDGLQRFAKPWYRRRALRVFRDRTGLAADPNLWNAITTAMDESEFFVLLASEEAVASPWVAREIGHWRDSKPLDNLLIVQTNGEIVWDDDAADFDWIRSTALSSALVGCFAFEPRHVDMRWADADDQLDLRNGRFRDQIAELAAVVHGVKKDEIAGEDVRQHRRTLRIAWSAAALLVVLMTAAVAASLFAADAAAEARRSERVARDNEAHAKRESNRADREAGNATRSAEDLARANAKLEQTNTELATTNDDLEQVNLQLVTARSETEQRRLEAVTNARRAETNAQRARQNAAVAEQNEALALEAERRAVYNRRVAEGEREEADRQRERAEDIAAALRLKTTEVQASNSELRASNRQGQSRALAAQALNESDDLDLGLLLAAAAWRASPSAAAHDALLQLADRSAGVEGFLRPPGVGPGSPVVANAVAVSTDGMWRAEFIAGDQGGTIYVWSGEPAHSARLVAEIDTGTTSAGSALFADELFFADDGSRVLAWDAATRTLRSWSTADPRPVSVEVNCECRPVITAEASVVLADGAGFDILDPATLSGPRLDGHLGDRPLAASGDCSRAPELGSASLDIAIEQQCESESGRWLVGSDATGTAAVWRALDGHPISFSAAMTPGSVSAVASDDSHAVAAGVDGTVEVVTLPDGAFVRSMTGGREPVGVAITPGGGTVATLDAGGTLTLHRLDGSTETVDLSSVAPVGGRLGFSLDGAVLTILAGSSDAAPTLTLLDVDHASVITSLAARGFVFDDQGHLLARRAGAADTVVVIGLTDGQVMHTLSPVGGAFAQFAVAPSQRYVAAIDRDGVVVWEGSDFAAGGRRLGGSAFAGQDGFDLAFSASGRLIVAESDGTLVEWDVAASAPGGVRAIRDIGCLGGECQPLFAVSPDGHTLVSVDPSAAATVVLEDVLAGTSQRVFPVTGQPHSVAFVPDGSRALIVDDSGTLVVPVESGSPLRVEGVEVVVSNSAGSSGYGIVGNRIVQVDLRTGSITGTNDLGLTPIRVALSGDGENLAVLDAHGHLVLWNTTTERVASRRPLPGGSGSHVDANLVMSRDGSTLGIWTNDQRVRVIDVKGRAADRTISAASKAIALSHDGRVLVTARPGPAGNEPGVSLWDTESMEQLGNGLDAGLPEIDPSIASDTGGVAPASANVLQFSHNGASLLVLQHVDAGPSGHARVTLREVIVTGRALQHHACDLAGRTLTNDEWNRFWPDAPDRTLCSAWFSSER